MWNCVKNQPKRLSPVLSAGETDTVTLSATDNTSPPPTLIGQQDFILYKHLRHKKWIGKIHRPHASVGDDNALKFWLAPPTFEINTMHYKEPPPKHLEARDSFAYRLTIKLRPPPQLWLSSTSRMSRQYDPPPKIVRRRDSLAQWRSRLERHRDPDGRYRLPAQEPPPTHLGARDSCAYRLTIKLRPPPQLWLTSASRMSRQYDPPPKDGHWTGIFARWRRRGQCARYPDGRYRLPALGVRDSRVYRAGMDSRRWTTYAKWITQPIHMAFRSFGVKSTSLRYSLISASRLFSGGQMRTTKHSGVIHITNSIPNISMRQLLPATKIIQDQFCLLGNYCLVKHRRDMTH